MKPEVKVANDWEQNKAPGSPTAGPECAYFQSLTNLPYSLWGRTNIYYDYVDVEGIEKLATYTCMSMFLKTKFNDHMHEFVMEYIVYAWRHAINTVTIPLFRHSRLVCHMYNSYCWCSYCKHCSQLHGSMLSSHNNMHTISVIQKYVYKNMPYILHRQNFLSVQNNNYIGRWEQRACI